MYAARDRPLPLGAVRELFPFLASLIAVFMALFRVVHPVVLQANQALREIRANDRQVRQLS